MKQGSRIYLALLVLAALSAVLVDYFTLPAWTFQSFGFWFILATYVVVFSVLVALLVGAGRASLYGVLAAIILVVVAFAASATSWLVWPGNAGRFYRQLSVEERPGAAFSRDFPGLAIKESPGVERVILPETDKQLSITTAQAKMGTYGARFQFNTEIFSAVAVRQGGTTRLLRVSPLDYTSSLVALSGAASGTEGYIEVDQVTGEGRLVTVEGGLRYTPGAVFGHNLDRHLRFRYRTLLFGAKSFEVDDTGHPWWVVPVVRHAVGLFGGPTGAGIVLVDPTTGATTRYLPGEEPTWVDRVLPSDLILVQANNHLKLGRGWFNALFGERRDVFQLSDSYNYLVSEGQGGAHAWLVAGVTSPNEADQTLAGFMAVNLRTGEARRYALSGITEMRAMEIAQNDERVRAQALQATWPILVDVDGEAAYYLFLKNSVQRQRFVYVDLATGQKVAMGETLEAAKSQFARLLGAKDVAPENVKTAVGTVLRVRDSPEDKGVIFILAGSSGDLYSAASDLGNGVRFLAPGDRVTLSYRETSASGGRRFVLSLVNETVGK